MELITSRPDGNLESNPYPRPPNYPLIYPNYPLLRAIWVPLKGHWAGGSWMEPLQKPFEPHAMILISESGRKITLRSLLENVEFREFPTTHVTACVYIYIYMHTLGIRFYFEVIVSMFSVNVVCGLPPPGNPTMAALDKKHTYICVHAILNVSPYMNEHSYLSNQPKP